jgi:Transposase DDE domain group 1
VHRCITSIVHDGPLLFVLECRVSAVSFSLDGSRALDPPLALRPSSVYEAVYCARGQAENLIKQHKAQLASDRTSCRSPLANQMRLILHTGAYWLLLDLRAAIPSWNPLRQTEFATIRLRLLKIAGRIIETASRIRIALASCCPEAETFSLIALKLQPSGP